jgi:hypothetical protein
VRNQTRITRTYRACVAITIVRAQITRLYTSRTRLGRVRVTFGKCKCAGWHRGFIVCPWLTHYSQRPCDVLASSKANEPQASLRMHAFIFDRFFGLDFHISLLLQPPRLQLQSQSIWQAVCDTTSPVFLFRFNVITKSTASSEKTDPTISSIYISAYTAAARNITNSSGTIETIRKAVCRSSGAGQTERLTMLSYRYPHR